MTRPKRHFDWVYRTNAIASDGSIDGLGTYQNVASTLVGGGSAAWILYDSHNHKELLLRGQSPPGGVQQSLSMAARAEGRNPLIRRVSAMIRVNPSAWALGSSYVIGLRLGIFEQDPDTGNVLLDVSYSMFADLGNAYVADWANSRENLREYRRYVLFTDASSSGQMHVQLNWAGMRRLLPHQCLAIYAETQGGSVNTTWQRWCRTLVADEA